MNIIKRRLKKIADNEKITETFLEENFGMEYSTDFESAVQYLLNTNRFSVTEKHDYDGEAWDTSNHPQNYSESHEYRFTNDKQVIVVSWDICGNGSTCNVYGGYDVEDK